MPNKKIIKGWIKTNVCIRELCSVDIVQKYYYATMKYTKGDLFKMFCDPDSKASV